MLKTKKLPPNHTIAGIAIIAFFITLSINIIGHHKMEVNIEKPEGISITIKSNQKS